MANLSDDDDDFGELIYRSSHTAKRLKREEGEQKKKPDKNTSTSSLDLDDVSIDREQTDAKLYQPVNVKSIDEGEDTDDDGGVLGVLEQKMPSSSPASVSQTQKMMAMLPENPPTLPPLPPIANNAD